MKLLFLPLLLLSAAYLPPAAAQTLHSPNGKLTLRVALTPAGEPTYQLAFGPKTVLQTSKLGLQLADAPGLEAGFRVVKTDSTLHDDKWAPVWGEVSRIRNHYRELALTLQQTGNGDRQMLVRFRLFDDGLGFRYEFPKQPNLAYFRVADERTEFHLTADHRAFWIPGDYDTNEYPYATTRLSEISPKAVAPAPEIGVQVRAGATVVQTPLMLKSADGLYINLHEAALVDYPAMELRVDPATFRLKADLVPDAVGSKAFLQTPAVTPWRTVVVSDQATDVLASKLILNLNEPSKIQGDVSWIKPQKFVGVWWEMHVNKGGWNYSDANNLTLATTDFSQLPPNNRHSANTANVKRYIDFAAKHHLQGVLVEGWNVGWEDWFGKWKEEVFDFVTPYPDFNLQELQTYAASKGVGLLMHHETSGSATNYERRLPAALDLMQRYGYGAVKTGYVGRIIPRGEHHDGQWMVNHYRRVAEAMAARKLLVDMHEPVRPTGLHRTYPNWLANEAGRGNEYNAAWAPGSPPEHETILPFTRLMGGPMDYTPGIFQLNLEPWNPARNKGKFVHSTLAKQLALYVTMYSPLQMAADLPEAYEAHPDAFRFIEDVAVDWDDSRYLQAEPGDYLTVARKAKGKDEWYLGAITDETARTQQVKLDFLPPGARYEATIYTDAPGAAWNNAQSATYRIRTQIVTSKTTLTLPLAPGGGAAVSLRTLN